jgi:hypothetical protein
MYFLEGSAAEFDEAQITRFKNTVNELELLKISRLEQAVLENAMFVFADGECAFFLEFLVDDIRLLHAANYHFFPILLSLN